MRFFAVWMLRNLPYVVSQTDYSFYSLLIRLQPK